MENVYPISEVIKSRISFTNLAGELNSTEGWRLIERRHIKGRKREFSSVTNQFYSGSTSLNFSAGDSNDGYGLKAVRVVPGERYLVTVAYRSDLVTTGGLSIKVLEKGEYPESGYIDSMSSVSDDDDSATILFGNQPIYTANTWNKYSGIYIPPAGVYWATLAIYWYDAPSDAQLWFEVAQFDEYVAGGSAASEIKLTTTGTGAATLNGGVLNIPTPIIPAPVVSSLTTTGTGPATLASGVLNVPTPIIPAPVVSSLTTTGTGPATLASGVLNVPTPSVQSLTTTGTGPATLASGVLNVPTPIIPVPVVSSLTTTGTGPATLASGVLNVPTPIIPEPVVSSLTTTGSGPATLLFGVLNVPTPPDITLTTTGSGAATLNGSVLNIPTPIIPDSLISSLTTTGTGPATLASGVLNVPTPSVQSLTTTGTGPATLTSGLLNIPTPIIPTPTFSSLTTAGTGPATLASGVLNVPKAVTTLTVAGSGAATFTAATGVLNVPRSVTSLSTTGTGAATYTPASGNLNVPVAMTQLTNNFAAASYYDQSSGILNIPLPNEVIIEKPLDIDNNNTLDRWNSYRDIIASGSNIVFFPPITTDDYSPFAKYLILRNNSIYLITIGFNDPSYTVNGLPDIVIYPGETYTFVPISDTKVVAVSSSKQAAGGGLKIQPVLVPSNTPSMSEWDSYQKLVAPINTNFELPPVGFEEFNPVTKSILIEVYGSGSVTVTIPNNGLINGYPFIIIYPDEAYLFIADGLDSTSANRYRRPEFNVTTFGGGGGSSSDYNAATNTINIPTPQLSGLVLESPLNLNVGFNQLPRWNSYTEIASADPNNLINLPIITPDDIFPYAKIARIKNVGSIPFSINYVPGTITSNVGVIIAPGEVFDIQTKTETLAVVTGTTRNTLTLTTSGSGVATLVPSTGLLNIPAPAVTSLTTTGSGNATLTSGVLNIPPASVAGLGLSFAPQLNSGVSAAAPSAWGTYQSINATAPNLTFALPAITPGDIAPNLKSIVIRNGGPLSFTLSLLGGTLTGQTVVKPNAQVTITALSLVNAVVGGSNTTWTDLTTTGTGAATLDSFNGVLNVPTPSVQSLTTTGTGAATLASGVLNVPTPIPYLTNVSSTTAPGNITLTNVWGTYQSVDPTVANPTVTISAPTASDLSPNLRSVILRNSSSINSLTVSVFGAALTGDDVVKPRQVVTVTPLPLGGAVISASNVVYPTVTTIAGATTINPITGVLNVPPNIFQSLTTTGSSGAATLTAGVLNVPNPESVIVETSAAAYTALPTDHKIVLLAPTAQTLTVVVPATLPRKEYVIVNNGNIDKILSLSYTRFDGVTTTVIPAYSSLTIQSTGALWKQVDGYASKIDLAGDLTLRSITISNATATVAPTAAQVDSSSTIKIIQTVVASVLTIPAPVTSSVAGRILEIHNDNTSTFPITFNSASGDVVTIIPGTKMPLTWNGNVWAKNAKEASAGVGGDTIQTAAATGATTIASWNSVVLIPTLTGNITLTYPTPVGNIGKTIKVILTGTPNAFTVIHTAAVGTLTLTNSGAELSAANGSYTVEAIDATNIRQIANISNVPVLAENGSISVPPFTTVAAPSDIGATTFTLPSAGKWQCIFTAPYLVPSGGSFDIAFVDASNVQVGQSARVGTSGAPSLGVVTLQAHITTTGPATYKVRLIAATGTSNLPFINPGTITYSKISGFTPVTGQSVDFKDAYINPSRTVTAVADVIFQTSGNGNIPYNNATGIFTLTAGKTYELESMLSVIVNSGTAVNGNIKYQWVDAVTNLALYTGQPFGFARVGNTGAASSENASSVPAIATYTPATNQTVKVRAIGVVLGGATILAIIGATNGSGSFAKIRQLGSTANTGLGLNLTTTGTGASTYNSGTSTLNIPNIINDQAVSGFIDIGNTRIQWGRSTMGAGVVTVSFPALFLNTNYSITGNGTGGASTVVIQAVTFNALSTSQFTFAITFINNAFNPPQANTNATVSWMAIGQKP